MGYLACPVCERQSLADVSDLQQRVASALNRPLSCPICSASVSGIQAFHHHLALHLPVQHKPYSDGGQSTPTPTTPSSLTVPQYPVTGSPEAMPTLERLEINDSRSSPLSPSVTSMAHREGREVSGESMQSEPESPSSVKSLSSQSRATQPHNCDLCGLVFSSEHFLKFHKDIIHSKRDFFDVTCKLCKDKFKDFEAYRNHVRESHSDRRYICDQCPKTFKMKGSLLVHTRMFHDPSSPGTCQLCKKTFTTKARKELHEKRYHGVGLEHIPTGKISPPSPSVKQQKTRNSSLGDAKNWLETLMTENKPSGDEVSRYKELQEQKMQHQMQHTPHQTSPLYPNQLNQTPQVQNAQDDQAGPKFASQLSHQHQTEHVKQKGSQDFKSQISQETQQFQKSQQTEPQIQQLQKWETDFQQYVSTQEKNNLAKISPDMYYHQQKLCISLPNHMAQQNYNSNRTRIDYNDFKHDKKFPVLSHGESPGCRPVGTNFSQQSPVAIVSPQPQKSETPPSDNQHSEVPSCHTEVRRNSFPLVNVNKLGISQTETPHIHPANYIGEISLNGSAAIPIPANQGMGIPTSGDKIQNTLAVSQQLIYQHSQNLIPTLNSSMTIMGSDNKIGVRVPPLFIPGTPVASMEKVKEPPDSPVQMMQVQEESRTSEMMGDDEVTEGKASHELPQEHRTDISHIQRQGTNVSTITRKDSNGKMDAKQWECDVCKKSFTTKYFLKKHKRLHTGETPYACAECGKTFTFQQSYHKHILYHSDDKPHQCSYCGRAFKEMSTLHNHVRIHTGEKPFVCETCGKAFRQRVSYLVHQRIHTGVMPYTCDTCGRSFRYKVSLRSHKCEPGVSSPSTATASVPSGVNGRTEVSGTETGQQNSPVPATVPATAASIILLPSPPVSTASTLVGVASSTGSSGRSDEPTMGGQQQVQLLSSSSSSGNSMRENEVSFHNNNRRHQQSQHRQRQHQQHRPLQKQPQEEQADKQRQQQEMNSGSGRSKSALETIDLSAISCDGLHVHQETKKYPSKSNKSPLQCVSPRSSGVTGMPAYHDPLSMAFLHALVDPQQGRLQGECRPHVQLPQDGLPFPSLSPGAMDTDLDHDNFLTNLLM